MVPINHFQVAVSLLKNIIILLAFNPPVITVNLIRQPGRA